MNCAFGSLLLSLHANCVVGHIRPWSHCKSCTCTLNNKGFCFHIYIFILLQSFHFVVFFSVLLLLLQPLLLLLLLFGFWYLFLKLLLLVIARIFQVTPVSTHKIQNNEWMAHCMIQYRIYSWNLTITCQFLTMPIWMAPNKFRINIFYWS